MPRVPGTPKVQRPGLILPGGRQLQPPGSSLQYPLVVEQILHAAGVNCVPMEDGAVMLRFPSMNGFVVSVPLSSQGCDELVRKVQEARAAGQQVDPSASVTEPSNDQPSAGPGESE
jgi:hypothetical protein